MTTPTPELMNELAEMAGPVQTALGQRLAEEGKVRRLVSKPGGSWEWMGEVQHGLRQHRAMIRMDEAGVDSSCTCLGIQQGTVCAHIVAVGLAAIWRESAEGEPVGAGSKASRPDRQRMAVLLDAFRETGHAIHPATFGTVSLKTQFSLKVVARYNQDKFLALGLNVGLKRLYAVRRMEEFLDRVDRQQTVYFTKLFSYDPTQHAFDAKTWEFLCAWRDIRRKIVKSNIPSSYEHFTNLPYGQQARYLEIPPLAWERLEPLLREVDVEYLGNPWRIQEPPLPIEAKMHRLHPRGTYHIALEGLAALTLLPAYGLAVGGDGICYHVEPGLAERLERLTRKLEGHPLSIELTPNDVETVMAEVMPQLRGIATVKIEEDVARRIVEAPLKTCVYLDWHQGDLIARVEYCYGEIVIDAMTGSTEAPAVAERIVVRDPGRERAMMEWFENADFRYNGKALHLGDEEAIFHFIYALLPELEADPAVTVYATERIQPMLTQRTLSPRARFELSSGLDWLEVSFAVEDLDPEEIRSLLAALVERRPYHRLADGRFVAFDADQFRTIEELFADVELTPADFAGGTVRLPAVRAAALIDREADRAVVQFGKGLRRWLDDLKHPDNLEASVPETLRAILRPYQVFGFQWMKMIAQYGFGGILADDMGLGKTLQSITFLLSEREVAPFADPALILCPASLMYNWAQEFRRFAPTLKVAVVNGSRAEREAIWAEGGHDVLITSYPLLRRDFDAYRSRHFHALILDEAQAVKNHATQIAQYAADLKSPRRFALTGTPVENSLDDLWSIFHAVFPALFKRRTAFAALPPEAVAHRIRPFVLRRLKRDVLRELPEKIETLETVELTTTQRKLYIGYLDQLRRDTADALAQGKFQSSRFKILAGLTRLRQICCHPGMFVEDYTGDSGKLDLLLELVEEALGADKRILIFSQFTSMLAIIRQAFGARGWEYFYLDGATPARDRVTLSEAFNQGAQALFLISLKAGGTGLNLTGADTVILYDLWWNPAVEEQAADRAHRIGQKHVVQVIRLITQGTIEEKMYALQQQKRDLIDQVVQASDQGLGALTETDVRELLML